MKKIAIILGCQGMGDIFCGVPTIKFLYYLYNEPVHVYTYSPELLKNYPYMNIHHIDDMNTIDTNKYSIIHTFNTQNFAHNRMDIRQFHAVNIGIQLTPSEMETEFFADEYKPITNLPEQFVAIHPVKTWPSRTWEKERWQELVDKLADVNIPVVAVGKESQEKGSFNTKKPTYKLNIRNGLDLLNKTDIHQTWHILNKSDITVTTNSGILIIAGMTDTHIIEIGGSFDPYFRSPYRKGTQDYKHSFILGECKLFCATDTKYSIKYNSLPKKMAPITYCLENPQTFGTEDDPDPNIYKCHPTTDQIYNEIIKVFKRKASNSNEGKIIL